MNKVVVKKEKLAIRCEVCHKADKFDPYSEYCSRCNALKLTIEKNNSTVIGNRIVNVEFILLYENNNLRFSYEDLNLAAVKVLVSLGMFFTLLILILGFCETTHSFQFLAAYNPYECFIQAIIFLSTLFYTSLFITCYYFHYIENQKQLYSE